MPAAVQRSTICPSPASDVTVGFGLIEIINPIGLEHRLAIGDFHHEHVWKELGGAHGSTGAASSCVPARGATLRNFDDGRFRWFGDRQGHGILTKRESLSVVRERYRVA
jgi:hypothetical protein